MLFGLLTSAGAVTFTGTRRAPATDASNASRVPSPPSAMGLQMTEACGSTVRHPAARAFAASVALMVPLKLSGAKTTLGTLWRALTEDYLDSLGT